MYNFDDIFEAPVENAEQAKKQIDRTISSARKCLNAQEFAEYRAQFEKSKEKMLRQMITFTNAFMSQDSGDMAFYGAKMARMVTKMQDLMVLLDTVELDARKSEAKNDQE